MPASFDWRQFDAGALADRKAELGLKVSVCVPARDEEATVGQVIGAVHDQLVTATGLVDELVVVDDGSADSTASTAAQAGARVVSLGEGRGKGEAMRRGLDETSGDLVVFCDADVYDFTARFVVGLLGPLIAHPGLVLVKGDYRRPLGGVEGEGGRVTELVAKPLVKLLFPQLAELGQPLAGEWAARRAVLEEIAFEPGYGVELGMLIDVAGRFGPDAIAQCDLGERRHRNRPLRQLAPMAETIMRLGLERAGLLPPS